MQAFFNFEYVVFYRNGTSSWRCYRVTTKWISSLRVSDTSTTL